MKIGTKVATWAGITLIGALLAGAAACGGEEAPTATSSPTTAPAGAAPTATPVPATATVAPTAAPTATAVPQAATPTAAATATPAPVGKRGGVLRWVPQASIPALDNVYSTTTVVWGISELIHEEPLARNALNDVGLQAVDAWKWETGADGTARFVMTLRDGLRFHDGTTVTSQDFLASLNRWLPKAKVANLWKTSLKGVEAKDEKTVVMLFDQPRPALLYDIASMGSPRLQIIPKATAEKFPASETITSHIGAGPYKFVSWDPGSKLVLERFDGYVPRKEPASWLAGARIAYLDRLEGIEIPVVETRIASLTTGVVDWVDAVPLDFYDRLKASDKAKPQLGGGPEPLIFFHFDNPPFDDPVKGKLLRQAVLAGINPEAVLQSYGPKDLWKTCSYWWGCENQWTNSSLIGKNPTNNLERAKALLKQAGYAGEPIKLVDPADHALVHPIVVVTKSYLESIGFKVDYRVTDWATEGQYQREAADKRSWHIMATYGAVRIDPVTHFFLQESNILHYKSPEIQELKAQYVAASDDQKRKQIRDRMAEIMYEDVPYVTFGLFRNMVGMNKNLEGYVMVDFSGSPYLIGLYWNK